MTFQIAHLLLRLAPLLAARPGEGNWCGDADAEQDESDCGNEAEIA